MSDGTRQSYLFLQSANRHSGSPSSANYVIQGHGASCDPGESITLGLRSVAMPFTWQQITTGVNDSFHALNVGNGFQYTVTIEPGTYSFKQMALALSLRMTAATGQQCNVTYDAVNSKLDFAFGTQAMFFIFYSNLAEYMGFSQTDAPSGMSFSSTKTLKPGAVDHLMLQVSGVTPTHYNLDNSQNNPEGARLSSVLAVIPVNCSPWGVIVFDDSFSSYTLDIRDKFIERLTLTWLTPDGQPASFVPDHTLALLLTFTKASLTEQLLTSMDESLKMLLLHATLP